MPRVEVAAIAGWSRFESHLERMAAFSSSDPDSEVYDEHPSILASNATSSRVR
jgi:hypothetical protein